ncbi:hypothetical protein H0H93_003837, partial [Arthromyces matolae]
DATHEVYSTLERLRLEKDDPVIVTKSQLKGSLGIIASVDVNASIATVSLFDYPEPVTLPVADLRKNLSIGDLVQVVDGVEQGKIGWIIALTDGEVTVWDHSTSQE